LRRRKSSRALTDKYVVLRELDDADQADDQRRSAWLNDALQSLDPALRETVLLVLSEELTHAEAAEILGCAESTVSWRMHMAKKELRARLEDCDG